MHNGTLMLFSGNSRPACLTE